MTGASLSPTYTRQPASGRFVTELVWSLVLLPPTLFAWHEATFQYDAYIPPDYGTLINSLTMASAVIVAAATWAGSYPKKLVRLAVGYILLAALHCVLDQIITTDRKLVFFAEAIGFALIMVPIISDGRVLHRFIRVNFLLGIVLIALNTVPVLHWLNLVTLPYKQVPRFGSAEGFFDLDPLHFGLFGLTENYVQPGHPMAVARLQGFSLEPIHWAYFVLLTVVCGCFLLPGRPSSRQRLAIIAVATLIVTHLFFIFSAVAFIAVTIWFGVIGASFVYRRSGASQKKETLFGMIVLVLMPGLMIPFLISRIPNLELYLMAEDILKEGANWESKIGFVSLGSSLYTRFLPTLGDPPASGHNLVLRTYLKYGYFLSLPLLIYLWAILKSAFSGVRFAILAGTSLAIIMHTIVVPPMLFYPTGAVLMLVAGGVAYHAARGKANAAVNNGGTGPGLAHPLAFR